MVLDREDEEKKQHKDKYLRGKVQQAKTTGKLQTENMKRSRHKDEYLTGKFQQLKTTQKKRKSTRTSISGARFNKRKQQGGNYKQRT